MKTKWQDDALLFVAALLLGFLLAHDFGTSSHDTIREKEIVRARPDTAHSVADVSLHPIKATAKENRTRTIILHDTLYREACLDTLIRNDTAAIAPDTLSVCYARNMFSVALGFSPRRKFIAVPYMARDTFYWQEDSIRFTDATGRAWYDDALVVVLSLAAGIIVGKL